MLEPPRPCIFGTLACATQGIAYWRIPAGWAGETCGVAHGSLKDVPHVACGMRNFEVSRQSVCVHGISLKGSKDFGALPNVVKYRNASKV